MPSGGARSRSGPPKDPNSGRSDRLGVQLGALDPTGYHGKIPEFPLQKIDVYDTYFEDKKRVKELDEVATEQRWEREQQLWEWAWSTPQAIAWAVAPWRWHAIGMWVRTAVICESSDAMAADKNSLHRFADQIGLTPAGLSENGWQIGPSELASTDDPKKKTGAVKRMSSRDRMPTNIKVVNGGDK